MTKPARNKEQAILEAAEREFLDSGKNGKLDPLKTDEGDHLKFLLQKSVKLFIGNGV